MSFLSKLVLFKKKEPKLTTEESYLKMNETVLNRLSPDSVVEGEENIVTGGNHTQTLVMVSYQTIIDQEVIQRISELNENVSIIQYIDYIESDVVESQMNTVIERNENKQISRYAKGSARRRARVENAAADVILENTSFKGKKLFYFQYLFHCVAQTQEELNSVIQRVKSELGSIGKSVYPRKRAKEAFESILPLGKNKVYDLTYRPMTAKAASYAFPFHENEIYMDSGKIKGRNMRTGNIVKVNEEELLNKHTCYIGISGSGKSTTMWTDMIRDWQFGNRIYTIDPKRDYGEKYAGMGGSWIKFSRDKNANIINMFDVGSRAASSEDGKVIYTNPLMDKISTLKAFFHVMYPKFTLLENAVMKANLNRALVQTYKKCGITNDTDFSQKKKTDFPIMDDFYSVISDWKETDKERFESLSEFHKVLEDFTSRGTYGNLFNGHTNVELDNDLICFDINEIYKDNDVNKLIYFLLLSYLRDAIINGDGRATKLYIDEAHIIADPNVVVAMEYLYELMKVVRAFDTGCGVATQSISDFLSAKTEHRNYGEAVIDQAVQMHILPMKRKEVEFVNQTLALRLDEEDMDFIELHDATKKEQAGKGFYYLGSKKVKMDVFLTDLEADIWFRNDFTKLDAA